MHKFVSFYFYGNCWFASFDTFESHDVSMTANIHVFAKSDLRGHHQNHFDLSAFRKGQISPYQRATGTQVLSAARAGAAFSWDAQENRYLIGKALTAAAFNPVLLRARHQQPI